MSRIRELYWRADREEHMLERHGVTWEEVEEAVLGDPGASEAARFYGEGS